VQQVAEKIRVAVEAIRFNIPDTDITLRVTVSIGVSVFRGSRREFFNAADRALYKSKAAGKNCVHFALT
jgi:diguanylate cyclase (GGDEF)-like protein